MLQVLRTVKLSHWATSMDMCPGSPLFAVGNSGECPHCVYLCFESPYKTLGYMFSSRHVLYKPIKFLYAHIKCFC